VPTLNTGLRASSGSCGMKPIRLDERRGQFVLAEDEQVLAFEPDLALLDPRALGRMPMMAR